MEKYCPQCGQRYGDTRQRFCPNDSRLLSLPDSYRLVGGALDGKYRWEYAARANSTKAYSFGDSETQLGDYAWFSGNSQSKAHPVGQRQPNGFGLYDMHGNVWEWCSDWYDGSYYAECKRQGVVTDPKGPSAGSDRVLRGGGWGSGGGGGRLALRSGYAPGGGPGARGFRLVRIGR